MPGVPSSGKYVNGQLIVGTLNFIEGATDEDIMATIFHEYMHYISRKNSIFIYRMEDEKSGSVYSEEDGIVYSEIDPCFEERQETEDEFFNSVCSSFIYDNLPTAMYYSFNYTELTVEQKKEIAEYIKTKNLTPSIHCFEFQYKPSNYAKDEINAHIQTLNMHGKLFQMSLRKQEIYKDEIERYNELYEKALKFEEKNNYNPSGYENN
jgi:hypothetical protein